MLLLVRVLSILPAALMLAALLKLASILVSAAFCLLSVLPLIAVGGKRWRAFSSIGCVWDVDECCRGRCRDDLSLPLLRRLLLLLCAQPCARWSC